MVFKVNRINQKLKNPIIVVALYILAFLSAYFLNKSDPGGPCTPGSGILLYSILILIAAFLFFKSLYKSILRDKSYIVPTMIHFVACSLLIIWGSYP